MTLKLHNNKIHAITGPFSNILTSALLINQLKLNIINPSNLDLYIPRMQQRVSKVQFTNAHHYEHDQIEYIMDYLEPIKDVDIFLNEKCYSVKHVNDVENVDGLLIFVGDPTAMQLYLLRKYKLTAIVCCSFILDYEFYDYCYSTCYLNESLKKTDCSGMITIYKPFTTDLYTLECNDTISIDVYRLPSGTETSTPSTNIKEEF